jgi:uncharacterized protein (TIGR02611 family)
MALGFVLLVAGVAMLALPGPGWLTIAGALAILAVEFEWARRALDRVKRIAARGREVITRRPADGQEVADTNHQSGDRGAR